MPTRIREKDLVIPALRAAAASLGGTISTSDLINVLTAEFTPSGQDAQILPDRNDTFFSQKVRNLISHRDSSTSMFTKGYAVYIPGSSADSGAIRITAAGLAFLDQVPDE